MARGRDAGHYFARQMALKHGEENVVFEAAVPWPAPPALPVGELHIDVGLVEQRIAIEAKNSVHIDSLFDSAVLQVAGALHYGRERFDSGLVVFLDHDYQITHEFPVFLTDELVEKVESIAAAVIEAGRPGGELPERVCGKPSDGIGLFCPFIEHCFEGWEPDETATWPDTQLASEGWIILRDLRARRGDVDQLEKDWEEWKRRAAEAGAPEGESMAGSLRVKHSLVKGRETFSLAKARTAGVWTPLDDERFGPFVKIGEQGHRFDVTKTEAEAPLDLDFGDASHLDDI